MAGPPRYETAKKVTIVNALSNTALAFFKILVGYLGHSQALLADGIHSLSDLISDALVLTAAKIGHKMPDADHPYGHRRVETLAAIIIAVILLVVGASIIYTTYLHIYHGKTVTIHGLPVIIAAVISIAIKEWLYRYTLAKGKAIHSQLLITNAYHNRSDVWVSALVIISAIGNIFGVPYTDNISAAIIGIVIIISGVKLFFHGIMELIDTGVDTATLTKIKDCIRNISGVISVHQLRTRSHGGKVFVDAHIIVNSFISVSEGHHIGEKVHQSLLDTFPQIADVIVHIDHENDETSHPSLNLPSRAEIIAQIQSHWQNLPGYHEIEKIDIHYVNGQIYLEVCWPSTAIPAQRWPGMVKTYHQNVQFIPQLAEIKLMVRI